MKVLMVCLGNICRSPLAEGILKTKVTQQSLDWHVDSAGTSSFHNGELPDSRSIEIASLNGIEITDQRSRLFVKDDFERFDLIMAMDTDNYNNILRLAESDDQKDKVHLILNYLYPGENRAVPDPYYDDGFPRVYNMLDLACDKILERHK